MSDSVVRYSYEREVMLWYFAESEPFGFYDRETKILTITNVWAMGEARPSVVEQDLKAAEREERLGSCVTYGVPPKGWELREKARYTPHEEM
jgi:hypothetical protein